MHSKYYKAFRPPAQICAELVASFASAGITQQQIQAATGVHQGQISRILNGDIRRVSRNVLRLCKYASIDPYASEQFAPTCDRVLMEAIEIAVAGSPQRAHALAGVVRAVARALDAQLPINQLGE